MHEDWNIYMNDSFCAVLKRKMSRPLLQSFLALVNLLSYPAVYELTGNQELPNKAEYSLREVPACIIVSCFLSIVLFPPCLLFDIGSKDII